MKISIEIKADNAAFDTGTEGEVCGTEVARILRRLADDILGQSMSDQMDGALFDINGNTVGFWSVDD
jgi:hypothetical protein